MCLARSNIGPEERIGDRGDGPPAEGLSDTTNERFGAPRHVLGGFFWLRRVDQVRIEAVPDLAIFTLLVEMLPTDGSLLDGGAGALGTPGQIIWIGKERLQGADFDVQVCVRLRGSGHSCFPFEKNG